ncbi:MAG: DUF3370 domain-containing protein [Synechococcus sp.]|nr:DUF3370 domain-containing protein [Synechococcus sp.]
MRQLLIPSLLGCALLAAPASAAPAQPKATETLRSGQVRPLPGQLDGRLMVNDNNPEVVRNNGILLSTFAGQGRAVPDAHLDVALNGDFELFSHHIYAGTKGAPESTLWLGVILGNRSDQEVTVRVPAGASWLSQPGAPFLPLPPRLEHDGVSVYAGPGSRTAADLLAGAPRPEAIPEQITLAPGEEQVMLTLPLPVKGLDPLLNGRTLQLRLHSDGPVSLATVGLISDQQPRAEALLELLDGGLSEKEHKASPKGAPGPIVYSRVSGVQQGSRWKARLSDPGSSVLSLGDEPISWPIASLQRGRLGTGQVQSAPLKAYYPGTSWEAHGNYGVEYDLELPLKNSSQQRRQYDLRLESPLKSDRPQGGLRFLQPANGPIWFRGSVEVRGTDDGPGRRFLHLVLRKGDPGQSLGRVTLAPGEQRNARVRLLVPADITPVQVLTVVPVKQSES